ncbi:MAG: hypothetical protein WKF77_22095 [Planctomycetaceae bacterium]
MTFRTCRILSSGLAAHAMAVLILLPPNGVVAQDKPEREGADNHRRSAVTQSELPDPEFSPHGAFLGPLEIAHIARFNKLPRRMCLEPHLIPPESVRTQEPGLVPLFDKTLREFDDDELLETAALSLARVAREKLQDISSSTDILLKHLESHSSLRVRFACARALVNADFRESGAALLKLDEHADDAQRLWIDPALTRWKFAAAGEMWKQRLATDTETNGTVGMLLSA